MALEREAEQTCAGLDGDGDGGGRGVGEVCVADDVGGEAGERVGCRAAVGAGGRGAWDGDYGRGTGAWREREGRGGCGGGHG